MVVKNFLHFSTITFMDESIEGTLKGLQDWSLGASITFMDESIEGTLKGLQDYLQIEDLHKSRISIFYFFYLL